MATHDIGRRCGEQGSAAAEHHRYELDADLVTLAGFEALPGDLAPLTTTLTTFLSPAISFAFATAASMSSGDERPGEDADGVRVVMPAGAGVRVDLGGPGAVVAAVVGECGERRGIETTAVRTVSIARLPT
jgi:hypothetical protein